MKNIINLLRKCTDEKYQIFWLLLAIVSVMGMADIPPANNLKVSLPVWVKWTGVCFIAAFKATFFVGLWLMCRKKGLAKALYYIFTSIYVVLCLVNYSCLHFYEMGISNKMLTLIAETNPSEAAEFLSTSLDKLKGALTPELFLTLLGLLLLILAIRYIPGRVYSWIVWVSSALGVISFCGLVADTFDGKNYYSMYARTAKCMIYVYRETKELNELIAKLPPYENASEVESAKKAFNVVVVYGESADRDHLSVYGYKLPTTPRMDSIPDGLYVFSDVISAAKLTKQSMEHMLTLKKDSESGNWWTYPLLIDIMKAAGYQTHWISNQERTGLLSNSIGAITSRADFVKYVGKTSNSDPLLQKYDEDLLPPLRRALEDTVSPKWIGLHLMGSHFVYENRYPENYNFFSGKDVEKAYPRDWMGDKQYATEAQYDNSIRYTDHVVGKMIGLLSRQSRPSLLIYLSDHGENVYADRDFCGRDLTSVKIPFVVFANKAFMNENPELVELLENAKDRKISSANMPYAIMTLTGTDCPDYDPSGDFLSPEYIEKHRYVAGKPWDYEE